MAIRFKSSLGATGSSDLAIKIKRDADDYLYDLDAGQLTFKAAGWTDLTLTMTEVDATNLPGEYEATVDASAWDDGTYTVYYSFSGSPSWSEAAEFGVVNGVEATLMASVPQPGQEAPPATTSLVNMLAYCFKFLRNKTTANKSTGKARVLADDGVQVDHEADFSDDGTTFTRGKYGTGA